LENKKLKKKVENELFFSLSLFLRITKLLQSHAAKAVRIKIGEDEKYLIIQEV